MNSFIRYCLRGIQYLTLRSRLRRFAEQLQFPKSAQVEKLRAIITRNTLTEFGKQHLFSAINSPDDYRRAVPVRAYSAFSPLIERAKNGESNILTAEPIEMFGITSGTEASAKFLPITRRFTIEHHYMHLMWLWQLIAVRPVEIIGDIFSVISPAVSGFTAGKIPFGSMSGKHYRDQSIPQRRLHVAPYEVFLLPDFLPRHYLLLLYALSADLRSVNCANPSTLAMLAQLLAQYAEPLLDDLASGNLNAEIFANFSAQQRRQFSRRPRPQRARVLRDRWRSEKILLPKMVWGNIVAINSWQGGCAPFYLPQVREQWGDAPMRCWGLRATEGIFSVPNADYSASGAVAVGGHFLEFADANAENLGEFPTTQLAHELTTGKRYRLIITTSAGLYRYDLADIVEVTGFHKNTPEIAFLYKAGGVVSLTGEKVTPEQIVAAMTAIAPPAALNGFTVGAIWQQSIGGYVLMIEPQTIEEIPAAELQNFVEKFDRALAERNIEYREKRHSRRLNAPRPLVLPPQSYQRYRDYKIKNGSNDGQIKPPQLLNIEKTREFFNVLGIRAFDR